MTTKEEKALLLKFVLWLERREIFLFHKTSLTSATLKGIDYLVQDFLTEKALMSDE